MPILSLPGRGKVAGILVALDKGGHRHFRRHSQQLFTVGLFRCFLLWKRVPAPAIHGATFITRRRWESVTINLTTRSTRLM